MTVTDTSFVFNGVPSTSFGILIARSGVHMPVLPPTRERLQVVPGRSGAWDYGAEIDSLKIEIDCTIVELSRGALMAQLQALATLLNPLAGPKPLTFSDRIGTWLARYSGVSDLAPIAQSGDFKLPFICVDPFAH